MCKNKTFFHFALPQNKPVESTDREAGLSDATSTEVSSQNTNEGSGSKSEKRKFQDVWNWKLEFLWLIIYYYSSDVMPCDVCRMSGPDIAGKTEFVTGKKKFKLESLFYHNESQKNEKCFNIWYQQKSTP